MEKKRESYRQTRNNAIDENIKKLKDAGMQFYYNREEKKKFVTPITFQQKAKSFIYITFIICAFGALSAWLFLKLFQTIL